MKQRLNYTFLITSAVLLGFGLLFLATLSAIASLDAFGNTNYYLFHQLMAVAIGLVGGLIAYKLPLAWIKKLSLPILLVNVVLLILVFLPVLGAKYWGARRWINIGPITLQPSELLKISSILYLSSWLSVKFHANQRHGLLATAKRNYNTFLRIFIPFVCLLGIIAMFLFFQKDLSTLGIIGLSLIVVYFAAGTPVWHTLLLGVSGASLAALLIAIEPYRIKRLLVFLRPEADPLGIGFQLKQSILAIGSGGWFGKGLGMSTQKFGFLPQAMGDSTFAIIGEELGMVGCTIFILLFVFFFWQCIKIAKNSNDPFGKLAAVGIATWMLLQTFMNVSSSLGIFPLAGIPLPFFSYGGSHIITELAAIGLLLNISKSK